MRRAPKRVASHERCGKPIIPWTTKKSQIFKAAVTGDTVGDPLKDTAGPSLHVVIKLLSTTILVLGPLFVGRTGASV